MSGICMTQAHRMHVARERVNTRMLPFIFHLHDVLRQLAALFSVSMPDGRVEEYMIQLYYCMSVGVSD